MSSNSKESFDDVKFMKELVHLRDTQEAIQSLSAWCIKNKKSAYKIARCWVKVTKKVKTEQKLPLFYLINDVVQHSKRKHFNEVIERTQSVLKEAMPHLKDETICSKVRRVLDIWGERQVFPDKFLKELVAILESGKKKDIHDIVDSFQPNQLCTQIKIMKALEDDTEYKLKTLSESDVNLIDFDENLLRQKLTDRQHGNDFIGEVEDSRKKLEQYIKAVDREITKRRQVKDLLEQARKYYDSLHEEANIVANAYTSFGKKVKTVNKKLDVKITTELGDGTKNSRSVASLLSEADLSPLPSPDFDAPSPISDDDTDDFKLPDDGGDTTPTYTGPGGQDTPPLPSTPNRTGERKPNTAEFQGEQMSISEYLTKLAGQDQPNPASGRGNNGFFYSMEESSYFVDPPPATSWPDPKSTPEYQAQAAWQLQQNDQDDPVPEWKIQAEDEEPEDEDCEIVEENLALARLQNKGHHENTLVQVKTDGNTRSSIDMEVVSSGDEVEVIPKHELSLQERLSNLAGITLPNQSPPHREPPHREPPHREPPLREPPQNEGGIRPWGAPQQQQPPHSHHQDTGPGPGKSYFKALESQNQNHHQEGPSKSYNKALEMAGNQPMAQHQQPPPRPFFAERPPGPPRGGGGPMRGPRPNFRGSPGGNFRGSPGGHRGGPRTPYTPRGRGVGGGNFRGGPRGSRPRW